MWWQGIEWEKFNAEDLETHIQEIFGEGILYKEYTYQRFELWLGAMNLDRFLDDERESKIYAEILELLAICYYLKEFVSIEYRKSTTKTFGFSPRAVVSHNKPLDSARHSYFSKRAQQLSKKLASLICQLDMNSQTEPVRLANGLSVLRQVV